MDWFFFLLPGSSPTSFTTSLSHFFLLVAASSTRPIFSSPVFKAEWSRLSIFILHLPFLSNTRPNFTRTSMAAIEVEAEAAAGPVIVDAAGIPAASPNSSHHARLSTPDTPTDSAVESKFRSASDPNMPNKLSEEIDGAVDDAAVDAAAGVASEVAEPEQQSGKTVSYHKNADIYIRAGESAGTAQLFKVSFSLVAAASPALINHINTQKPSVSCSGNLVFDLAGLETEAHGLDIVLSIIHYKFHEIPSRPDVDLLCSMARVVEKFNCAHLLVPYMEKWCVPACLFVSARRRQSN